MLVFAHIPKTGGTAITAAFRKSFGADRVFRSTGAGGFKHINLKRYAAVSTHAPLPYLRTKCGSAVYCTVVREPLDRTVSLFADIVRRELLPHYIQAAQGMEAWLEWLRKNPVHHQSVHQSHFLGQSLDLDVVKRATDGVIVGDQRFISAFLRQVLRHAGATFSPADRRNVAPSRPPTAPAEEEMIRSVFATDFEIYSWLISEGRIPSASAGAPESA